MPVARCPAPSGSKNDERAFQHVGYMTPETTSDVSLVSMPAVTVRHQHPGPDAKRSGPRGGTTHLDIMRLSGPAAIPDQL